MPRAKQSNALLGHLRPGAAEETADDNLAPRSGPRGRNTAARLVWWTGSLVILAGIATGGFLAGGLAAWLEMAPAIEAFEQYDPPQTTTLLDREGQPIATMFDQRRQVVGLGDLPSQLPEAFLAIEDANFRHHIGLDMKGIARAAIVNASRGSLSQGASTITQQLPRNLLPEIGREKTLERKVHETLIALQMERLYSKDQILEVYLNQIYLGSGNYGVEAAAQMYFGKAAGDLNLEESALLAGLPQLPERYSPLNDPEAALRRREQVLARMKELGWITDTQYEQADAATLDVAGPAESGAGDADYFLDAVRAELGKEPALEGERARSAGWRIRTTMDREAQEIALRTLQEGLDTVERDWLAARPERFDAERGSDRWYLPPRPGEVRMGRVVRTFPGSLVGEVAGNWRADLAIPAPTQNYFTGAAPGMGVDVEVQEVLPDKRLFRGRLLPQTRLQGALVCLDSRTGEILALAGGREWADRENNGYFNRALRARRQAGSTLKPFFFAAALENGTTPWTMFDDEPLVFSDGYSPRNYESIHFGPTSLQTALEHSRNVVTIQMVQRFGLRDAIRRVREFDVTPGAPHWEMPIEYAVALGTSGVTPLEAAAAYVAFANAGEAFTPTAIRTIRSAEGRPLLTRKRKPQHQLDARTAAWMQQMLVGVMTRGTGKRLRETLPAELRDAVGGKTGTTSENRDAWFAGYTPETVVAVWVGFDQPLPLGAGQTGGRVAGPIWAQFVSEYWAASEPHTRTQLPMPPGWRMELVDFSTGRASNAPTAGEEAVWRAFPDGSAPEQAPIAQ